MLDYISYILFFGILIIIIIYIYIQQKYGFWAIQPVFHVYNINYMFNPPGIIDEKLPLKNKYTNFKNIETIIYNNLTSLQTQRFLNLIKLNYLQNKNNVFNPKLSNIDPYFYGHNDKTFVTFYNEDNYLIENKSKNLTKYSSMSLWSRS
jgi:hypothetical protein